MHGGFRDLNSLCGNRMPVAISVVPGREKNDVDEPPETETTGRQEFQHTKTDGPCIKPVNAEEAEHDGKHEGDDPILLRNEDGWRHSD